MDIFAKLANAYLNAKGDGEQLSPIENAVEQSPDELKLVAYIRSKIDMVRQTNSRIAQEGIMFTNIAYILGFDGVYYDTTYRQFRNVDPKRKLSRNRFKINKVLPTVQNRLARLCQSPPKYDVRPNSNSSEDKDCARLGLQIIDDVFDKQNFTEKQQDLLMCAMQGGVAYGQIVWDPTLGKPMVDPNTVDTGQGEQPADLNDLNDDTPNAQEPTPKIQGYEGDVRIEILNMLEVFPDPLAKNLDDAAWVIKAKVRKLDYFRDRYERGNAVKEEDVWLLSSIYDLKQNSMTSLGIAGAQTNEQMRNSAIELVYEEKRSPKYPNGRLIITASGVLLEDKELPIGEFDIVKFDDILVGGRYHSEAIITHLRPIQDQYNITRTKCADWVKKTLGGKYIAAKGAGLSQEAINNDSGEVVEYNPVAGAAPPSAMSIPTIPAYVYDDIKVLSEEFDFVSGINEASRGVSPGAQMPFRGMALLVEQDQTRISVQTNRNEIGYAKLGSIILKYVGKYYEMPRMLKIAGDGLEYTVKEFKGADLRDNFDVVVIPGSSVPGSKVLKRQDIINAFQMGLLGDPQDPKLRAKVLRMMEFGDVAEMWKDQALDEQQVKKVIAEIESNTFNVKNPGHEWDNHEFFIQQMNQYRKTDKFEKLSQQQQGIFNYVAEWHLQAFLQLTNPGVAQQQMMAQHSLNTAKTMQMQQQLGMVVGGQGGPPGIPQAQPPQGPQQTPGPQPLGPQSGAA